MSSPSHHRQRLDQWLWHARFFKTRTLATALCRKSKIRVDGAVQNKAAALITPGQVLTFPKAGKIRVIKVLGLSTRRGPALAVATLYEDLTPPQEKIRTSRSRNAAVRIRGAGRPTKKDRRALMRLKAD